ncbi:hypothetical protein [Brachybacterium sp. YJGR34]|uniref:hypothetical protein n=1 Tax=Brachybacterium sp. YJGR34 TaxID=2059911 RepID=UPI001E5C291F|nr:hypothetical protein [Brachybacterium sp. YJGR34]
MNSQRTPGGRSSEERLKRRRTLVGILALAMLGSWLLMLAPLPFSLLAALTAVVALVVLIPLIVESVKERRYATAAIGALLGIPATLMIIGGAVLSGLFYGPMAEIEECRATAITEQARTQCEAAAQDSMAQWVSRLIGG